MSDRTHYMSSLCLMTSYFKLLSILGRFVLYPFVGNMRLVCHLDLIALTRDHSLHRHILFCWLADFFLGPFQISPHMISSAINEQKFAPIVLLFSVCFPSVYDCILELHAPPDYASSLRRRWQ